ncbi:MAG: ABC transporter permease, partial [Saprospiraceae bacterium]
GASISSVVYLLSKDFMKLALIAVIIAFPLGWWAMNKWLEGFVYKVEIGPYIFVISFALILVITMVTVGYQAVKAAIANPIQALRTE